jgi:hypothetical protein
MLIRWIIAALHLLALGMGLGAVWARARALHLSLDTPGLQRVCRYAVGCRCPAVDCHGPVASVWGPGEGSCLLSP